ncbi:uncharacterized protein TNCV_4368701 [Trichonephila clavipes]|nr:uncharacterized protein TNCV_4368701 [Trichonephila clavipes]
MSDHRTYQKLHRKLREIHSFQVTRHDSSRLRDVSSSILEESNLNVVADRPESSSRAVAYHVVPDLNTADYLLRLPVGSTKICTAAALRSSSAEQLRTVIVNITFVNDALNKHLLFFLLLFFVFVPHRVNCAHTFLYSK